MSVGQIFLIDRFGTFNCCFSFLTFWVQPMFQIKFNSAQKMTQWNLFWQLAFKKFTNGPDKLEGLFQVEL